MGTILWFFMTCSGTLELCLHVGLIVSAGTQMVNKDFSMESGRKGYCCLTLLLFAYYESADVVYKKRLYRRLYTYGFISIGHKPFKKKSISWLCVVMLKKWYAPHDKLSASWMAFCPSFASVARPFVL